MDIHLRTWGAPSLPPLLLLHGLGSTSRIWELTAPWLANSFQAWAPDQRGHGFSSKPPTGYNWASVCDDVIALLDTLGIAKTYLMGHSWGADVALELAVRHPDRLLAVGLIDGGIIDFRAHLSWPQAEKLLEPQDVVGLIPTELRIAIADWLTSLPAPEQQEIILANYQVREDGTVAPHHPYGANMAIARALWEHRPPELYKELHLPTFIAQAIPSLPRSAEDEMFYAWRSECVALAEATIKQVQVVRMPDTVHDIPLQRPKLLADRWKEFVSSLA